MSTPALYTAGTRPHSLLNESGLYLTDFSVKPERTWDEVVGIPSAGSSPEWLYTEGKTLITTIILTGMPIPTSAGAYQGLAALDDAASIVSLANLTDGEIFGLEISVGTIVSQNPELKKARTGTGREISLTAKHGHSLV